MATFEGQLWLVGDPEGSLEALLEVTGERILVTSAGSQIGNWKTSDIVVGQTGTGYRISAEGEELMFQTSEPGLLAAVHNESSLASRIKAAKKDEAVEPPTSPQVSPRPEMMSAGPTSGSGSLAGWWQARKTSHKAAVVGMTSLVVLAMAGVFSDSEPQTADQGTTRTTNPSAPVAAADTGDWPSVSAYVADLQETGEKMGTLLGTVGEVAIDASNGDITLSQFSALMGTAIEAAVSHRDYFRGTTAPDGFEAAHEHLVRALELFVDAFEMAQRGADNGDLAAIELASSLMEQGTDEINRATSNLPGQ